MNKKIMSITLFIIILSTMLLSGCASKQVTNTTQTTTQGDVSIAKKTGSGLCYRNADCSAYAQANCPGAGTVKCSADNQCHCCEVTSSGACKSCTAEPAGCSTDSFCEGGICVLKAGGPI